MLRTAVAWLVLNLVGCAEGRVGPVETFVASEQAFFSAVGLPSDADAASGQLASSSDAGISVISDAGRVVARQARDAAEPDAPSFATIYEQVLKPSNCDSYLCHGADGGGLDLTSPAMGYADLVAAPSTGPECGELGLERVVPGEPEESLLYLKLFDTTPCGDPMPPSSTRMLSADDIALIRDWILAGAPR
ncbi:MAG: hypothetical protein OXR73_37065 [Myxococcales bacterium]|nr:hypothetical protein [Myxococcales bacterium]